MCVHFPESSMARWTETGLTSTLVLLLHCFMAVRDTQPRERISQNPVPSHNLVFPGNGSLQEDLLYCIKLSWVFPELRASHFLEAPHSTMRHLLESKKGIDSQP